MFIQGVPAEPSTDACMCGNPVCWHIPETWSLGPPSDGIKPYYHIAVLFMSAYMPFIEFKYQYTLFPISCVAATWSSLSLGYCLHTHLANSDFDQQGCQWFEQGHKWFQQSRTCKKKSKEGPMLRYGPLQVPEPCLVWPQNQRLDWVCRATLNQMHTQEQNLLHDQVTSLANWIRSDHSENVIRLVSCVCSTTESDGEHVCQCGVYTLILVYLRCICH